MLKIRTPSPKLAGQLTSSPSKSKLTIISGSSPKSWSGKHLWVRCGYLLHHIYFIDFIESLIDLLYLERDLNLPQASQQPTHHIPGKK